MKFKTSPKIRPILCMLALPALAAGKDGNDTIALKDVMGSPMEAITPFLAEIKWLFGTVWGWAFLLILLCIGIALIKAAYGTVTGSAQTTQSGKGGLIEIVGIVFIGIVSTGLVVFLFNTFVFK